MDVNASLNKVQSTRNLSKYKHTDILFKRFKRNKLKILYNRNQPIVSWKTFFICCHDTHIQVIFMSEHFLLSIYFQLDGKDENSKI